MRVLVKYFYFTVGLRWKKGEICLLGVRRSSVSLDNTEQVCQFLGVRGVKEVIEVKAITFAGSELTIGGRARPPILLLFYSFTFLLLNTFLIREAELTHSYCSTLPKSSPKVHLKFTFASYLPLAADGSTSDISLYRLLARIMNS